MTDTISTNQRSAVLSTGRIIKAGGKRLASLLRRMIPQKGQMSYSQCGEDLIVQFAVAEMGLRQKVSYLDIGGYHPFRLNNTYGFYRRGSKGVLIEPNPVLAKNISRHRRRDVCLNVGISADGRKSGQLHIFDEPTLSTFSGQEAERISAYGNKHVLQILDIPLMTVNEVMAQYFKGAPDFISLDVEGLDFQILQSVDWVRYRPVVLCVETITYTENNTERKIQDILDYMKQQGYFIYADTYINSIFVDKHRWKAR